MPKPNKGKRAILFAEVPRDIKAQWKVHCIRRGWTMADRLAELMLKDIEGKIK